MQLNARAPEARAWRPPGSRTVIRASRRARPPRERTRAAGGVSLAIVAGRPAVACDVLPYTSSARATCKMPSGGDKVGVDNEFGTAEPRPFAACQALFTLSADGQQLTSSANGRTFHVGPFGTPSVGKCLLSTLVDTYCARSSGSCVGLSYVCVLRTAELRAQLAALPRPHAAGGSGLTFANITANAKTLHLDAANAGGNLSMCLFTATHFLCRPA